MSSWRGTECSEVFLVLKRSFTVSLSLLDVVLVRGGVFIVCLGFVSILSLNIQSFADSPAC